MVGTTELSDKIAEIGKGVLYSENGFDFMGRVKKGWISIERTRQCFDDCLSTFSLFNDLVKSYDLTLPLQRKHISSKDYHSYLALSLIERDVTNSIQNMKFNNAAMGAAIKGTDADLQEHLLELNEMTVKYENARIGLRMLPFIANADVSYLDNIGVNNAFLMLSSRLGDSVNLSYTLCNVDSVSLEQYVIGYKLVEHSFDNLRSYEGKESIINLKFENSPSKFVVSVEDCGKGIEGISLPDVFDSYNAPGIGVGLQIVKRIADISNATIKVRSKVEGRDVNCYNEKSGLFGDNKQYAKEYFKRYGKQVPVGTSVEITFPKN